MKRKYIRPATEAMRLQSLLHITESSYIPIGGGGGFDVKRHQGNWEIEWEGTFSDDDEENDDDGIF